MSLVNVCEDLFEVFFALGEHSYGRGNEGLIYGSFGGEHHWMELADGDIELLEEGEHDWMVFGLPPLFRHFFTVLSQFMEIFGHVEEEGHVHVQL